MILVHEVGRDLDDLAQLRALITVINLVHGTFADGSGWPIAATP
jgi:hypothetical protein